MSVSSTNIQAQLTPSTNLPKTTPEQEKLLQSSFSNNRNPTELDLILIAAEVGLSEDDVKRWYQHRLACWRQQQGLPANSRSIMD
uniref:Homeodomain-only protein n=1 Tax=Crassostrea virginica TaxID=6565 RepID=A0A8B8EJM6_CRAVI|nr:homeodomain-only protein-like [Crassostrea virginica]